MPMRKNNFKFAAAAHRKGECLGCGGAIPRTFDTEPLPYCSKECQGIKGINDARLEAEYGYPAREVIVTALNQTGNIETTAKLLDMSISMLHGTIKRMGIMKKYR